MKYVISMAFCLLLSLACRAQVCNPEAVFQTVSGEEITDASEAQDAPLVGHFMANPEDIDGFSARYEWKIWKADTPNELLVHRFDQDIDYTFSSSGAYRVQLYATFVQNGDTITWPEQGEENPFPVVICESKLEMPNAFSPNGDGINDRYNAKKEYKSIISFKASIFNRWGQKIYSWTNPDVEQDGWDGTWHGRTVRDGVYFVVVNAVGADGHKYNIRKDVNVLTGFDNGAKNGVEDEP